MADLLPRSGTRRRSLRDLLRNGRPVLAPGCHDALSARLVAQVGFDVVYMGGFATTASLLGRPDVGLLGGSEMIDNARRIVQTVELPVIADADTGYGNPLNVIRTVCEYERAGVAAIHLEDQVSPKRCGHMTGKRVIPTAEMLAKVRAAVAARDDPEFVLIARTDALAVEGVEAAIDRACRYADAGADVLWVEAPTTEAELERIAVRLEGHTVLLNWLEQGRTPPIGIERIRELGFALVLFPIGSVLAMVAGLREYLQCLRAHGTPVGCLERLPSFEQFNAVVGLGEVEALGQRFRSGEPVAED
ncbi:isocitrate lyase/PEP mutase family protein [Nannocystis punicea]|uniref:Isocitrate lyase/PEP mutase family protein n=1 Tax=Nannocystis punicea TaxID=2995304 RepID=A0ABY7H8X4_9BACT|nr:isocitrate lyase/PEP mutase family protein [Nannocystis poenicansa]WAS95540.1 isocitrate lyase/PEP mutase family protein [Nannocystis poenicansa]